MDDIMKLYDRVRKRAYAIHEYHAHGLIINFVSFKFEIKKYTLKPTSKIGVAKLINFLISFFAFSAFFRG